MKLLEFIVEAICWLGIFISPTAILTFSGFVVYSNYSNTVGRVLFIALSMLGIILGILLAEKIRRKIGCAEFMTRISKWS